jgi:hypothetical protein
VRDIVYSELIYQKLMTMMLDYNEEEIKALVGRDERSFEKESTITSIKSFVDKIN